jgi:hypothetical protein
MEAALKEDVSAIANDISRRLDEISVEEDFPCPKTRSSDYFVGKARSLKTSAIRKNRGG